MFETNIFEVFFSKGYLLLIFVVLQIKISHIYLSMSRMIDCVFYNPVENYSRGHPLYPSEISTLWPPHPLGISINHPWGGYGYFLESHILSKNQILLASPQTSYGVCFCSSRIHFKVTSLFNSYFNLFLIISRQKCILYKSIFF